MAELKAFAESRLRPADFEKFKADLELLLGTFTAQMLANWMGKDKGHLSKKINGIEPVTAKFISDFYRSLDPVISRIRQGAAPHEVEAEMSIRPRESEETIVRLKVTIYDMERAIKVVNIEVVKIQGVLEELQAEVRSVREVADGVQEEVGGIRMTLREHDAAIRALQAVIFGGSGSG